MKHQPLLAIFALLVFFCGQAFAQTAPKLLPFQGRLTDQSGAAVSNGVRLVQFKIYSVPTGGSPVWAGELHRTTVNGGLVNVLLGSKTPFTGVDFDQQLYLEITVDINGDNSITLADPPMLPRQAILPVVFAKEAADSRLLAGHDWTPIFGTNNPTIPIPASKLADGSLPGSKIQTASITSNQIAPETLNASLITPGTVTASQIAPNTITSNQIANGMIDLSDLAQQVAEALNPPGTIQAFGGTNIPSGWLLCDGSALDKDNLSYTRLFNAIGKAWGNGTASGLGALFPSVASGTNQTDFNIPDLRGYFLRGVSGSTGRDPDSNTRTLAQVGGNSGNQVGSSQTNQIQSHLHVIGGATAGGAGGTERIISPYGTSSPNTGRFSWESGLEGGSETRPVNAYVNYIIKY